MRLTDLVTSLELSERLKKLGVPQQSIFYYRGETIIGGNDLNGYDMRTDLIDKDCSAFTSGELDNYLPVKIPNSDIITTGTTYHQLRFSIENGNLNTSKRYHCCGYRAENGILFFPFMDENGADMRANLLIHLLENGLVKI